MWWNSKIYNNMSPPAYIRDLSEKHPTSFTLGKTTECRLVTLSVMEGGSVMYLACRWHGHHFCLLLCCTVIWFSCNYKWSKITVNCTKTLCEVLYKVWWYSIRSDSQHSNTPWQQWYGHETDENGVHLHQGWPHVCGESHSVGGHQQLIVMQLLMDCEPW